MTPEQKDWIDNATFEELLRKWRFTETSEGYFQGELGDYFISEMAKRREALTPAEKVAASKAVGWRRS